MRFDISSIFITRRSAEGCTIWKLNNGVMSKKLQPGIEVGSN